jgi:uncharacterized protein with PIN domain
MDSARLQLVRLFHIKWLSTLTCGGLVSTFFRITSKRPIRLGYPSSKTKATTDILSELTQQTHDMEATIDQSHKTYLVCRALPTFTYLSDKALKNAIETSIGTYLPDLKAFDDALPSHFHRKSKAAWLEFTCVTIHVCNLLAGFCLTPKQAAAMMKHVDLSYRSDDFMETVVDAYGILDISVVFEALERCFEPYLGSSIRNKRSHHRPRKVDSPMEGLSPMVDPMQFEHDLRDVVERMHSYPICSASKQDRQWYSLELYDFLVAQLEQLDSELPKSIVPGQLHKWVTDVGARSVGTNYMFAMFTCLVSAEDGQSPWKSASSLYLAQEFAQQISVEFRLLNDVGGRVRDLRDGTMSSCTLVQDGEYTELLKIADFAAESSAALLERLAGANADDERRTRALLDMFRKSVRLSGELYMANEPNRVAS